MPDTKLRKLPIDRGFFEMAFERDVDYAEYPDHAILDRETGELIWFYEADEAAYSAAGLDPEENRATREQVEAAPARYLEIPGLDHGEHHDILRAFLKSDWTGDEGLWRRTYDLYTGSIGRWKKALRDPRVLDAYDAFRNRRIAERAEDFLREHGIDPEWT